MTGREYVLKEIMKMNDDVLAELYSRVRCEDCTIRSYCRNVSVSNKEDRCKGIIRNYLKIEEV